MTDSRDLFLPLVWRASPDEADSSSLPPDALLEALPDETLIRLVARGGDAALAELLLRYEARLTSFVRWSLEGASEQRIRLSRGFQVRQHPPQRLGVSRLRSGTLCCRSGLPFRLSLLRLGRCDLPVKRLSLRLLPRLRCGKARHFGPECFGCRCQPVLVTPQRQRFLACLIGQPAQHQHTAQRVLCLRRDGEQRLGWE